MHFMDQSHQFLSAASDWLASLPLAPRFAALGAPFHTPVAANALPAPQLLQFNAPLAAQLGLDVAAESSPELLEILAGNSAWPDYAPLASVYAGHQFGVYVSQLGDGRARMIAELRTPDGSGMELQLKGAGPTPYARGSDGRAVLRSSIREYLCSEAMHALGVPTTRCLSLVASPQAVQRETLESAAVVCRVAPSFVRFGHFEYFRESAMQAVLADHVIDAHFPHLEGLADRYAAWLGEVVERTAQMIAHWQALGFCHGVMNTDNFSILGLTLDYGPFGFIDGFRHHHVCNHSDHAGRYAFNAQPQVGQWNCGRLLQASLPLLSAVPQQAEEIAAAIYARYAPAYSQAVMRRWAAKLGLHAVREGDSDLVNRLLLILHKGKSDFTRSLRKLALVQASSDAPAAGAREEIADLAAFDAWIADYRTRLRAENNLDDAARAARMNRVNPKYVLRNHLAQAAIEQAQSGEHAEIGRLARLLERPYDEQPEMEHYAAAAPVHQRQIEISCSS